MSALHNYTTIQYRIENIVKTEQQILANQKKIIKLLELVVNSPTHISEITLVRDSSTNTPPPSIIITREQSTQSPINKDSSLQNGENLENDPIYARTTQSKPYSCPTDA